MEKMYYAVREEQEQKFVEIFSQSKVTPSFEQFMFGQDVMRRRDNEVQELVTNYYEEVDDIGTTLDCMREVLEQNFKLRTMYFESLERAEESGKDYRRFL